MGDSCSHLGTIQVVTPASKGCEECLKLGWEWFHLRVCRTCGHVGCCDQSRGKHATKHFHRSKHPIIEGYDPPEGWAWCYLALNGVARNRFRISWRFVHSFEYRG